MDVNVSTVEDISIVALQGSIDGSTAPAAQEQILPLLQPGCRIVLDMAQVSFMSSAGLRIMVLVYRRAAAVGGQIVLTGLLEEIKDTMALTGFLDFFTTCDTVDEGLARLKQ